MKRPIQIQLNPFQLVALLDEEHTYYYDLILADKVYCVHCQSMAVKGIEVKEIYLNELNDIMVRGICNICNNAVARILEFGTNKVFYENAMKYRKQLENLRY